jgi:hypothetical protein
MRAIASVFLLASCCLLNSAWSQELVFSDLSKAEVFRDDWAPVDFFAKAQNPWSAENLNLVKAYQPILIGVTTKRFNADLTMAIRSGPVLSSNEARGSLRVRYPKLEKTLRSVDTAYEFVQNGNSFRYAAAPNLNTAALDLDKCSNQKPCSRIFEIKLITFEKAGHLPYKIGVLMSIKTSAKAQKAAAN